MAEERNQFILTWMIENFSCSALKSGEYFRSPSFRIDMPTETRWKFKMYPRGNIDKKSVALFLYREKKGNVESVSVGFKLQILNTEGIPEISLNVDNRSFAQNTDFGYNNLILKNDLYVVKRKQLLHKDCLTVRAKIWKSEGNLSKTSHCFARTVMCKEVVHFDWNIKQFSSFSNATVLAPPPSEESPKITTKLLLHGGPCCNKNLKIEVTVEDSKRFKVVIASISLLDDRSRKVEKKKDEIWLNATNEAVTWTLPCFYPTKLLSKKGYLKEDTLRLYLEFVASKGVVYEAVESLISDSEGLIDESGFTRRTALNESESEETEDEEVEEMNGLSNDLLLTRRDGLRSDVTLQAGHQSFPAHRLLLCARSPVFRAMFAADMREGAEGTVRVEDIDGDTLQRLLDFFYTDSAGDLRVETATRLYFAADKYQVPLLRRLCRVFLLEHVSFSNAPDLLVLADAHGDVRFKSSVVSFIRRHCSKVCGTDAWMSMMKSHSYLAAETMHKMIPK